MLKIEKCQYLNSIFQLNYTRYKKTLYDTKLFTIKRSTNLNRKIFLQNVYFSF